MKKLLLSGLGKAKGLIEEIEDRIKEEPSSEASAKAPPTSPPEHQHPAPQQAEQAALPGITAPEISDFDDRKPMNDLLRKWAKVSGRTAKEHKAMVREYAGVVMVSDLTKGQVKDVCAWIERQIAKEKNHGQ